MTGSFSNIVRLLVPGRLQLFIKNVQSATIFYFLIQRCRRAARKRKWPKLQYMFALEISSRVDNGRRGSNSFLNLWKENNPTLWACLLGIGREAVLPDTLQGLQRAKKHFMRVTWMLLVFVDVSCDVSSLLSPWYKYKLFSWLLNSIELEINRLCTR